MLAADFLEANFDRVFSGHYQKLLHSDNYVTRRQSLKLLGELLLDRHNFSVSLNLEFVNHKRLQESVNSASQLPFDISNFLMA